MMFCYIIGCFFTFMFLLFNKALLTTVDLKEKRSLCCFAGSSRLHCPLISQKHGEASCLGISRYWKQEGYSLQMNLWSFLEKKNSAGFSRVMAFYANSLNVDSHQSCRMPGISPPAILSLQKLDKSPVFLGFHWSSLLALFLSPENFYSL